MLVSIFIVLVLTHANFRNNELYSGQKLSMQTHSGIRSSDDDESDETNNMWIRISDSIHIYSAYLDMRPFIINKSRLVSNSSQYTLIRIIGLLKVPPKRQIIKEDPFKWLRIKDEAEVSNQYTCKLVIYLQNGEKVTLSEENILTRSIFEEGIKVFAGTFFNCYVKLGNEEIKRLIGSSNSSLYVSMAPVNVSGYPDKLLRVRMKNISSSSDKKKLSDNKIKLSVCIRPLFGVDTLNRLSQFVSYYRLMGVERFNFYELSISPEVRKYLLRLKLTGTTINVSLRKWNLPTGNTSELWDFGSLAALNDCLYSEWVKEESNDNDEVVVLFVDIDEFIVPQGKNKDGMDLIKLIGSVGDFHELKARNVFFCKEFCGGNGSSSSSHDITRCFIRTKRIWSAQDRSKFLVKPGNVVSVGHHSVTEFVQRRDPLYLAKYSKVMSKDLALMNHYRECRSLGESKTLERKCVKDTTLLELLQGKMKQFSRVKIVK